MKQNGSWDSKADPFGDFTIIFEAANNNIKILNYPVRYYARKSGAPNISRWIDGLKLLKVCWIYMISDIWKVNKIFACIFLGFLISPN